MKYKKIFYLVLCTIMIDVSPVWAQDVVLEPIISTSDLRDELNLRQSDGLDNMSGYITKKFFKNRLEYYIKNELQYYQYVLGPNKGDKIILENVLPVSQNNIKIGQEPYDIQPNIVIWGGEWYGVTKSEANVPGFNDFAMAVEKRNNSDTSYNNLSIKSGKADKSGISISSSGTSIIITRTENIHTTDVLSNGNIDISAVFTNNYGTATNTGTSFGGSNSDWHTSDASENSFVDTLSLNFNFPMISVFDVDVKNDNKVLYLGQSFSEEPEDFYNINHLPSESSLTQASWKIKPNMNVTGLQTAILQVTNTSRGYLQTKELKVHFNIKNPLKLQVPSISNLGTYKLGSSNTILSWNETSKVEVEGVNNFQWDLSVSLNSDSSLKGYLKIGEKSITEIPQKVISGTGSMVVSDEVSPDKFIKVDYTGVKHLRKDTGTLQWSLTPSTKGVSE